VVEYIESEMRSNHEEKKNEEEEEEDNHLLDHVNTSTGDIEDSIVSSSSSSMEFGYQNPFLALCLSSRKNLCIHPTIMNESGDGERVDSLCRDMTSSWVRDRASSGFIFDLI